MSTEYDTIREMFHMKQEKELADLRKANQELRSSVENSNRVLKGLVDVRTYIPPSVQSQ